jgi:glycosyltransferase involved in cell wall biosynthesis
VSQSVPASGGYCVLIPTYNNRQTVRRIVESSLEVAGTVIVVDDGCTDGTTDELAELPIVLLRHRRNRGKGAALRTGFRRAHELGYTHTVTLDSDGQHYPEEIPRLVEASRENPDAIVIGARDMSGEHVPKSSSFGRMFSNYWLKVATGIEVGDSQSGFRVYPLRHVTRVGTMFRKFTYECEVIIRMAWGGCAIVNVPVRVHYPPKAERVTHFHPFWDNVRFSCLYLYMNFSYLLIPVPHKRLVPRPAAERGLRGWWNRMLSLADLPQELTRGGPIKRFRALVRYLVREKNTPGELGLAVGIGAFIGCSPWIGFHWVLALYAATRVHLNRIACIAATNVSFGPLTAVIAIASIWLGKLLLGQSLWIPRTTDWQTLSQFAWQSLGAWALGSAIFGLVAAFATGLGTLYGVRALRRRKRNHRPTAPPVPDETNGDAA